GDAEQDDVARALVAFEDLVRDACECAGDVGLVEDRSPVATGGGAGWRRRPPRTLGRRHLPNLLSRLAGRVLKDVEPVSTVAVGQARSHTGRRADEALRQVVPPAHHRAQPKTVM